jgi:hypothetical protein
VDIRGPERQAFRGSRHPGACRSGPEDLRPVGPLFAPGGLLQALDPRVKLLFLVGCVVLVSLKKEPLAQGLIAALLLLLALLSRVSLPALYGRVLALGLIFGVLVSLPSALSIFTPGEVLVPILAPLPGWKDLVVLSPGGRSASPAKGCWGWPP